MIFRELVPHPGGKHQPSQLWIAARAQPQPARHLPEAGSGQREALWARARRGAALG